MMLLCEIIFRQLNMPPLKRYDREDFARPANEREYIGETLGQERYGEAAKIFLRWRGDFEVSNRFYILRGIFS